MAPDRSDDARLEDAPLLARPPRGTRSAGERRRVRAALALGLGAGAALGFTIAGWRPDRSASPPPVDRAANEPSASARVVQVPSFAPIVASARNGVVRVRTVLAGANGTGGGGDHEATVNGTGFVVHRDGLVVTNQHLIQGHVLVVVDVPGHEPRRAELVGEDAASDLAVLRLVDPPDDLQPLPLGDSTTVRQGDWVVTIGNPFDFLGSVTAGVVSYVGRHLSDEGMPVTNEYLQFSAPVNPGSSGGPVLDLAGNVVGVTTRAFASAEGVAQGISFAVPARVVRWVLDMMDRHGGRVPRGYVGIRFRSAGWPRAGAAGNERAAAGARILAVEPGGPADLGGVREGDLVVAWDGHGVASAHELHDRITSTLPGTRVDLAVQREGAVCHLRLDVAALPPPAVGDVASRAPAPAVHGKPAGERPL